MRRRPLVAIVLLLAACAESTPVASGTAPTSTSLEPTTTATTSVPVGGLPVVEPLPTLADDRPATFVGVTAEYEAVEVDTATGRIIRSFGQAATAAEVAAAECAACVNVLDGVWRTIDGAAVFVSECCEPASGQIHLLPADGTIDDPHPVLDGWTVAPSPVAAEAVVVGYSISLVVPGAGAVGRLSQDDGSLGMSVAGWSRDGSTVAWIDQREGWSLVTVDATAVDPVERVVRLPWAGDRDRLEDLAVDAAGRYVTFRNPGSDDVAGVVFDGEGAITETFAVEPGSQLGGFDRTGRLLLYLDGDGAVRWRGPGGSGVLAEGFLAVSW